MGSHATQIGRLTTAAQMQANAAIIADVRVSPSQFTAIGICTVGGRNYMKLSAAAIGSDSVNVRAADRDDARTRSAS